LPQKNNDVPATSLPLTRYVLFFFFMCREINLKVLPDIADILDSFFLSSNNKRIPGRNQSLGRSCVRSYEQGDPLTVKFSSLSFNSRDRPPPHQGISPRSEDPFPTKAQPPVLPSIKESPLRRAFMTGQISDFFGS